MHIYLNPHCNFGNGGSDWQKIELTLRDHYGEFEVEEIHSPENFSNQIEKTINKGERVFIAAGGDGTVNLLVNALMNLPLEKHDFIIGAVGLGSSNDFHKPFSLESFVGGIPTRMNVKKLILSDLIRVKYKNSQNHTLTRYSLINASIGITAQANAFYNSRHPFIVWVKRFSHNAAVVLSALNTIVTYKNIPCTLAIGNSNPCSVRLTNLGVIKNPNFAGSLCYNSSIKPDDGKFEIILCYEMSKFEAISTLLRFYKRQYQDLPKMKSWFANDLSVTSTRPFALEMDGEVVSTHHVEFRLMYKAVRCCL